jgi:hypothetical protein
LFCLRLFFFSFSFSQYRKNARKKTPSVFWVFFSPTTGLSCVFSCLFFCFSLLFLFFSPPFARSLEGLIYSLIYLYLGKIQCINSRMQISANLQ